MRPSSSPCDPAQPPGPPTIGAAAFPAEQPGSLPGGAAGPSLDGQPSPAGPPADSADPFAAVFGDARVDRACGPDAWLSAMLDAERTLAATLADADLIPVAAAEAIGRTCRTDAVTADVFANASAASPVIPLVNALTEAVPQEARGWVHYGATSQDIMDTAMSLVGHRATAVIADHLDAAASAAADLAEAHRETLQIGRTLGQHAAPTTFGALAATWLSGIGAARAQLHAARAELAAQLGGPVGTLETYGPQGLPILTGFANRLGLADPGLPWHTERSRITRLAAALAIVAGTLAKVAHDVTILSSGDIGELREGGHGGSSAMPHKRNPADSVLVLANARQAPGLASTLFAALESELQRPAGAWQSEWQTLSRLLRCCGGASSHAVTLLTGLRVDAVRMRSNLDDTGGLLRAGAVADRLAASLGRREAHQHVTELAARAEETRFLDQPGVTRLGFRALLNADPVVAAHLSPSELDAVCDPVAVLPAARAIVDRALDRHRAQEEP